MDTYECDEYSITADRYEVISDEEVRAYFVNDEDYEVYSEIVDSHHKVVLVYATLNVKDAENMNPQWWQQCELTADNGYGNAVSPFLHDYVKDNNINISYITGNEYSVILPYEINEKAATSKDYAKADSWKYSIVWCKNPIYYSELSN